MAEQKEGGGGQRMIYFALFWSFFQIGLFSIGGGYAALPLIQNQVVNMHGWLSMQEFADIITISQMTPGPIAINAATFVGTRIAGPWGAVTATLSCILPSCIIVLTLAWLYYKYRELDMIQGVLAGLRPAVVSLIASAGLSILTLALWNSKPVSADLQNFDFAAAAIFAAGLFVLRKWKPNPIWVMAGAGAIGLVLYQFILV